MTRPLLLLMTLLVLWLEAGVVLLALTVLCPTLLTYTWRSQLAMAVLLFYSNARVVIKETLR